MVKDHSDSERGNPLPPHRLLFPISSKCFLCASLAGMRIILIDGKPFVSISRSSQCSTIGVTKAVVHAILFVGWCI